VDIAHAGGTQISFDFNGKCVPGTVAATKTAGAAWSGSAALDTNGTVTIATTAVTAASLIFLNCSATGGTVGGLYRAASADIVAGTSFIIRAFVASTAGAVTAATTDTSTIQWWIIN
jgi:hypothetical protein